MITKNNAKEIFEQLLKEGRFQQAIEDDGDFLYISISTFNPGHVANICSCHYDGENELEASEHGDLYIDKDDALQMLTDFQLDIEHEPEGQG